ncbi:MAG: ACT domain-containing protein [Myxococcota bacterium]
MAACHNGEVCGSFRPNRPGMLAKISQVCEQSGVNINRAEASTESMPATVKLEVELRDVSEMARLIASLERIPGVEAVHRTVG